MQLNVILTRLTLPALIYTFKNYIRLFSFKWILQISDILPRVWECFDPYFPILGNEHLLYLQHQMYRLPPHSGSIYNSLVNYLPSANLFFNLYFILWPLMFLFSSSYIDGNFLAIGSHDNYIYIYAVAENGRKYSRVGKCSVSTCIYNPPHPLFQVPFCFTFIFSSLLSSAFQCFLDVCLQRTGKVINNNPQSHTLLRLCINISRIIYSSWIPILTPLWKYCEVCVAVCVWDTFLNFSNFSQGHSSFITHLDWSVDSQYLVSNSGDYEILYCKSLILRFPLGLI